MPGGGYTVQVTSQINKSSIGLAFVSIGWALFLAIIGSPEVLLFTLPVFILAGALALGSYPGDRLLDALSRIGAHRPRPGATTFDGRIATFRTPLRGSLLIALHLAGRAPPVPA